jgi:hypothetical protein
MLRVGARQEPGSSGHRKRLSRLRRRAEPEVLAAYEQGRISARKADELLYLSPAAQRQKISNLVAGQDELARRSKIAAQVIKAHIETGRRDLVGLKQDLIRALCSATTSSHA